MRVGLLPVPGTGANTSAMSAIANSQVPQNGQRPQSPVHTQYLYHYPKATRRTQFKRLAATFNHLESESCGLIKFAGVQKNVVASFLGNKS